VHECHSEPRSPLLQGATFIDQRFKDHVRRAVGADTFDRWAADRPHDLLALQTGAWETRKRLHCLTARHDVEVLLPGSLCARMSPEARDFLAETQKGDDDRLVLTASTMDRMFQPSVDSVSVDHMHMASRGV
jgi:hypothetical protein